MNTPLDIVVNPVNSKFARALQGALADKVVNKIYRRLIPKHIAAKQTIISKRGNILRRGSAAFVRDHFVVTPRVLNKVEQFERFQQHQVDCPKFALNAESAYNLNVKTLFARTLINSTNGKGIIEFKRGDGTNYPAAPLYTEYISKKAEYRFHVFAGEVIDIQQKKKKAGVDERNTRVRNLHNGYVYCRDDIATPNGSADLAIRAVAACGYQYGAVDVIYNEKRNQCYVLEVNSRPGLMGTTLEKYAEALIKHFNLEQKV